MVFPFSRSPGSEQDAVKDTNELEYEKIINIKEHQNKLKLDHRHNHSQNENMRVKIWF